MMAPTNTAPNWGVCLSRWIVSLQQPCDFSEEVITTQDPALCNIWASYWVMCFPLTPDWAESQRCQTIAVKVRDNRWFNLSPIKARTVDTLKKRLKFFWNHWHLWPDWFIGSCRWSLSTIKKMNQGHSFWSILCIRLKAEELLRPQTLWPHRSQNCEVNIWGE